MKNSLPENWTEQNLSSELFSITGRGGSRIFSNQGADFQKSFKKFCRPFCRSTKLIFPALSKHCFVSILAKFSWQKFEQIQAKKGVFRHFLGKFWLKNCKKIPPSKLVYIGAEGATRKLLGSITKNGYWKIVQRGTLWVGRGLNPWGEGASASNPSKSAPDYGSENTSCCNVHCYRIAMNSFTNERR